MAMIYHWLDEDGDRTLCERNGSIDPHSERFVDRDAPKPIVPADADVDELEESFSICSVCDGYALGVDGFEWAEIKQAEMWDTLRRKRQEARRAAQIA